MTYTEQLHAAQLAGLYRAQENYAARCDRLAAELGPGYDLDDEATNEEGSDPE